MKKCEKGDYEFTNMERKYNERRNPIVSNKETIKKVDFFFKKEYDVRA